MMRMTRIGTKMPMAIWPEMEKPWLWFGMMGCKDGVGKDAEVGFVGRGVGDGVGDEDGSWKCEGVWLVEEEVEDGLKGPEDLSVADVTERVEENTTVTPLVKVVMVDISSGVCSTAPVAARSKQYPPPSPHACPRAQQTPPHSKSPSAQTLLHPPDAAASIGQQWKAPTMSAHDSFAPPFPTGQLLSHEGKDEQGREHTAPPSLRTSDLITSTFGVR